MSFPKLKVMKPFGYPYEEVRNFEESRYFLFSYGAAAVVVEGQVINSYEELVRLASQDRYKDRELLEVLIVPPLTGGG